MELVSEHITCWQRNKHIIKGYKNKKMVTAISYCAYQKYLDGAHFSWSLGKEPQDLGWSSRRLHLWSILRPDSYMIWFVETDSLHPLIVGSGSCSSISDLQVGPTFTEHLQLDSSTMSHPAPLIIYSIYAEFSEHYSLAILQSFQSPPARFIESFSISVGHFFLPFIYLYCWIMETEPFRLFLDNLQSHRRTPGLEISFQ